MKKKTFLFYFFQGQVIGQTSFPSAYKISSEILPGFFMELPERVSSLTAKKTPYMDCGIVCSWFPCRYNWFSFVISFSQLQSKIKHKTLQVSCLHKVNTIDDYNDPGQSSDSPCINTYIYIELNSSITKF